MEHAPGEPLRWGIIGTGRIAGVFAKALAGSERGRVIAVGSRNRARAEGFAREHRIERPYESYAALLADPDVQAVYVATPHSEHAEWAIRSAEAGKHILCEKPLTLNHAEATAVLEAARRCDVFLMEAFAYRFHPQIEELLRLVREGTVGEVQLVRGAYSFRTEAGPEQRLLNPQLGGGGILDVGCYPVSLARLVVASVLGRPLVEPVELRATGHLGPTGVDEWAVASLRFEGGILAQVRTGVRLRDDNSFHVVGTRGSITLADATAHGDGRLVLRRNGAEERIEVPFSGSVYELEAAAVARNLDRRQAPELPWEETLANLRTLDRWRAEIGLEYPAERPPGAGQARTVAGRPLRSERGQMVYGRLPAIEVDASRIVMGVATQRTWAEVAVMLDDFFERGGRCFDTAWIYGSGRSEQMLGAWVRSRGVRDQVVIIDKGAHTPLCDPDHLSEQILQSLERLGVDHIDLYLMHRDNPRFGVGDFLTVLEEHRRAGRLRAYGASNWTLERLDEARRWAGGHDAQGFTAVSNNLSLARMVNPPWAGCVDARGDAWRRWLVETKTPLLPWSSQAQGFFARAHSEDASDPELARCWYAGDNFERLARAKELARARGVEPTAVALAWVLQQPFQTFPLIGPHTPGEARTSLEAVGLQLSAEELAWLDEGKDGLT